MYSFPSTSRIRTPSARDRPRAARRDAAGDVPCPLGEDALGLCLLFRRHAWFREGRILCALARCGRPSHFPADADVQPKGSDRRGCDACGSCARCAEPDRPLSVTAKDASLLRLDRLRPPADVHRVHESERVRGRALVLHVERGAEGTARDGSPHLRPAVPTGYMVEALAEQHLLARNRLEAAADGEEDDRPEVPRPALRPT